MIVKLARCEHARDKELGVHAPFGYVPPAMTIGWKVIIDEKQNAMLSLDDIKDLCHDTFFRNEQTRRNAMKTDK